MQQKFLCCHLDHQNDAALGNHDKCAVSTVASTTDAFISDDSHSNKKRVGVLLLVEKTRHTPGCLPNQFLIAYLHKKKGYSSLLPSFLCQACCSIEPDTDHVLTFTVDFKVFFI